MNPTDTIYLLLRRSMLLISFVAGALSLSAMRVYVDHLVYYEANGSPYAEVLFSFDYATFSPRYTDSTESAGARIVLTLLRDTSVLVFRKGDILSPIYRKGEYSDFTHLERFAVKPGAYQLRIEISDMFSLSSKTEVYEQAIHIQAAQPSITISQPQLVAAFRLSDELCPMCKSGYELLPYIKSYIPGDMKSLAFYAEIYGTQVFFGESKPFVIRAMLTDGNGQEISKCTQQWRGTSAQVVPILRTLDIKDLPDGEYHLRIEVRDKDNQVIEASEKKINRAGFRDNSWQSADINVALPAYFQSFQDSAMLYGKIMYLMPVALDNDRFTMQNQLLKADLKTLQLFYYNFWYKRNPSDPEASCREYEQRVKEVESAFSYRGKKGWQTDRGRVYLQYGKPNTRIIRPSDPDYWPFEIWHYYETDNNLHNRRFLFYDTALGGDMELLHSDVPSEVKNFTWKEMVRSRPAALNMSDASSVNAAQRSDPFSRDEIENLWYSPH
jgi:GWxTD domain-containing protein